MTKPREQEIRQAAKKDNLSSGDKESFRENKSFTSADLRLLKDDNMVFNNDLRLPLFQKIDQAFIDLNLSGRAFIDSKLLNLEHVPVNNTLFYAFNFSVFTETTTYQRLHIEILIQILQKEIGAL